MSLKFDPLVLEHKNLPVYGVDCQYSIPSDISMAMIKTSTNGRHQRFQQFGLLQFAQKTKCRTSYELVRVLQILEQFIQWSMLKHINTGTEWLTTVHNLPCDMHHTQESSREVVFRHHLSLAKFPRIWGAVSWFDGHYKEEQNEWWSWEDLGTSLHSTPTGSLSSKLPPYHDFQHALIKSIKSSHICKLP